MEPKSNKLRNAIILILVCLMIMGGAFYFSRTYLIIYPIEGDSMNSTLQDGEYALVFRTHKVKYDDIIIFYDPDYVNPTTGKKGRYLVKRVIGLAGDKMEIKYSYDDEAFHVYRNGEMVNEDHIDEPITSYNEEISVTVPNGKIFYLGDNRNHSYDSHYGNTYAEVEQLEGVVFLKYKGAKFKFM